MQCLKTKNKFLLNFITILSQCMNKYLTGNHRFKLKTIKFINKSTLIKQYLSQFLVNNVN